MNKGFIFLVAAALLSGCQQENNAIEKQAQKSVIVYASGELESAESHLLAPPSIKRMWQYQIKFLAPENSAVKQGQVVIKFDDKQVQDRLLEKAGELEQAKKTLENEASSEKKNEQELILAVAEQQMNYDKAKRKAQIIDHSRSDIERKKSQIDFTIAQNDLFLAKKKLDYHYQTTELNLKMAQGKVDRLSTEVNVLEGEIEKLKVKSPIDGFVIYKTNFDDEKLSVGETAQFGQAVVEVVKLDKMQVKAQIDEPDSGKVLPGQRVKVILDGSSERVVSGKVLNLGGVFREKSWQDKRRIIDAQISLDEIETSVMRPGMSARIEIEVAEKSQTQGGAL